MAQSIGKISPEPLKVSCETSKDEARDISDRLYEALEDSPDKWETIARFMDVDVSLLSHWTSNRGPMPLYRLIRLTRAIGPGLLRYVAKQCGYDIVRIEEKASSRLAS